MNFFTTTTPEPQLTPFQDFLYLGSEFLRSCTVGRRESYPQTRANLLPIPTGHDFLIFLYCSLACFAFSWGTRVTIVEPVARRILPKVTKKKVEKFAQAR